MQFIPFWHYAFCSRKGRKGLSFSHFSFLSHSCSFFPTAYFCFLSLTHCVLVSYTSCELSISPRTFFEQLWRRKEKASTTNNSLHNTKTTRSTFNIILWRLLFYFELLKQKCRGDFHSSLSSYHNWAIQSKRQTDFNFELQT